MCVCACAHRCHRHHHCRSYSSSNSEWDKIIMFFFCAFFCGLLCVRALAFACMCLCVSVCPSLFRYYFPLSRFIFLSCRSSDHRSAVCVCVCFSRRFFRITSFCFSFFITLNMRHSNIVGMNAMRARDSLMTSYTRSVVWLGCAREPRACARVGRIQHTKYIICT